MQDMNASATADHKALRALAVAKVPSNREQERRRPMAPSIGGTSKFEIGALPRPTRAIGLSPRRRSEAWVSSKRDRN